MLPDGREWTAFSVLCGCAIIITAIAITKVPLPGMVSDVIVIVSALLLVFVVVRFDKFIYALWLGLEPLHTGLRRLFGDR